MNKDTTETNYPHVVPLDPWYTSRGIKRFLPAPPAMFPGRKPTKADILLALELIGALDEHSRHWYSHSETDLRRRLEAME